MNDLNPSPEFEEKVRNAMKSPDASPEFANRLRNELVRRPVKMKPMIFKPAWALAFMLALTVIVVSAPGLAAALGRVFGYIPEVGLVETTSGLRMLAEPVSATRDGITLTITNVFVYEDRVELKYEVKGIEPVYGNASGMCGAVRPDNNFWSDADADLRLPDGTLIRRDYAGEYQFANRYAMQPVYAVQLPADVDELILVLKCIPFTKLGEVPENWEIPFKLMTVPAGTVVGFPVIEVTPPATEEAPASISTEVVPAPKVTMTLDRIVPTDSATVFYLAFNMENHDPSLISIMPAGVYVIDSLGHKIQLIGSYVWQPFEHRIGSSFEFVSASKPADGPLTVLVEQTIAYYAPLYTDPPQARVEDMSFTFDVGTAPQHGQVWELDEEIDVAGYYVKVTSARAVLWEDVATPDYIDGSQGFDYGYQFSVQADPALKMNVELELLSEKCGYTVGVPFHPEGSSLLNTQLCREAYPTGQLTVYVREIAVMMAEELSVEWMP